jgi:hypothetical protein
MVDVRRRGERPQARKKRRDRATRLALRMGDVMNVRLSQRPTTEQQLAVLAVRRNDRFCFDAVSGYPSSALPLSPTSLVRLSMSQPTTDTVERA